MADGRHVRALRYERAQKVSDYLTDRKYSLLQKQRQWVLCCGEDIAWLVGERTDNRFRVDEHTRKVTLVRMVKE